MADIFDSIKKSWLKGMEAVGNAASSIATNTKQKVSELNIENRRREIMADLSVICYALWQQGIELPKELDDLLKELSALDETLAELRAQRFKEDEAARQASENEQADEEAAEKTLLADAEEADIPTQAYAPESMTESDPSEDASAADEDVSRSEYTNDR